MKSLVLILSLFIFGNVYSHSGGTDSSGCHTNHSTGDYHCHSPKFYKPQTQTLKDTKEKMAYGYCCKTCVKGKACGNSCISRYKQCHQPPGCACDG